MSHLREVSRIGATVFAIVCVGFTMFIVGIVCATTWAHS
jgi:hypothetical protein